MPIHEVRLSDGTIRYAIDLRIGGTPVLAGLDTGSNGLRLLPAAQNGLQRSKETLQVTFGAGVRFDGVIAKADVTLGPHSKTIDVQAVDATTCGARPGESERPCPLPFREYGVLGDELPHEGFAAIFGTKSVAASRLDNPLVSLGIHRWIVRLPKSGDDASGALTLNPTAEQTAGFIPLTPGPEPGSVSACISREGPAPLRICGATTFDTGAPGLSVAGATQDGAWVAGTPISVTFAGADRASIHGLRLDDRAQHTRFRLASESIGSVRIRTGLIVYEADDVLYDGDTGTISIRPRPSL